MNGGKTQRLIKFYMNDESTRYSPQNVTTVLEPDVEPDHLEQDKVQDWQTNAGI
jgi:hypothetical protein